MNIAAFTEIGPAAYPGYISINLREGKIQVTVREPGSNGRIQATTPITPEELRKVATDALRFLDSPC